MSWPPALRVVPVVTVPDAERAVPLAAALRDGGLPVVEVTLRTAAALDAVARIRAALPDVLVGAGTVRTAADVKAAVDAGAQFLVSPGTTPALLDALLGTGLPVLPGASTVSEAMTLLERGVTQGKFFPAEAAGGPATLTAWSGPLAEMSWCATGGVRAENARAYLDLSNVVAVGGAWMAPAEAIATADWATVTALASRAATL